MRDTTLRVIERYYTRKEIKTKAYGFDFSLEVSYFAKLRADSALVYDPDGIYMLERIDAEVLEFAIWFDVDIIKTIETHLELGKGGVVESLFFSFASFSPL